MKVTEKGFTLVELVIAMAISSVIMSGLAMTVVTLVKNHEWSISHNIALQQVQNAGHWISNDVRMAESVILGNPNGFPLTLDIPVDTDENNDYSIEYVFDGDKLKRKVYDPSLTLTSETFIAQYVDVEDTTFVSVDSYSYKLTVKASRDDAVEERIYEISQRVDS